MSTESAMCKRLRTFVPVDKLCGMSPDSVGRVELYASPDAKNDSDVRRLVAELRSLGFDAHGVKKSMVQRNGAIMYRETDLDDNEIRCVSLSQIGAEMGGMPRLQLGSAAVYWTLIRERKPKEKGFKRIWLTVDATDGRAIALFTTEEMAKNYAASIGGDWMTAKIDQKHLSSFVDGNMFHGDAHGRPGQPCAHRSGRSRRAREHPDAV